MTRIARLLLVAMSAVAILLVAAGVILAEGALRVPRAVYRTPSDGVASSLASAAGSKSENVSIAAPDGALLEAWWFTPPGDARGAVLLLHGVRDTRLGMTGHVPYLLGASYAVLLPDSRGHGRSGGDIVTYGVLERHDIHAWTGWLRRQGIRTLYGIGVSMGASILLQAVPGGDFLAVVAESPFSCFREIALYRVAQVTAGLSGRAPLLFAPMLEAAFLYTRARSGLDLNQACPLRAIEADAGRTAVLLIHGAEDQNIPVVHSRQLAKAGAIPLWEVRRAGHCEALGQNYAEYARRVLAHFAAHESP